MTKLNYDPNFCMYLSSFLPYGSFRCTQFTDFVWKVFATSTNMSKIICSPASFVKSIPVHVYKYIDMPCMTEGRANILNSNCMYWLKHCLTLDVALPEGHDVAVGTETSHAHALVHLHHICP